MAKIRADRDVTGNANRTARTNAEGKLKGKATKAQAGPVIHEALPTEAEFNTAFDRIKSAERKLNKAQTAAKELTTVAKAGLNKAYADAAAAMIGRKISIRSLKRLYVLSNRDEDELTAEITGETWAMRALGFRVGEQLALFPDGVKDTKDAAAKARRDGRDAGATNASISDNPHHPGSVPGQAWAAGYHDGQASLVTGSNVSNIAKARKAKAKPDDGDVEDENEPEFSEAAE
jgi:hypothetical protein